MNIRGKLRIPVFGNIVYIYIFIRDLINIEIVVFISIIGVFHWNIGGKLRYPVFGNIFIL